MTTRRLLVRLVLALAVPLGACTPTVNVAAPEPIVIQLNISHEVRVRIDEDVEELIDEETRRGEVGTRSLDPTSPQADARRLAEARGAGRVGERADGYLGIVPDAGTPEIAAAVERENQRRRAEYEALVTAHGATLREIEAVAGARRIAEAAAGEWVMTAEGNWITKS